MRPLTQAMVAQGYTYAYATISPWMVCLTP